MTDQYLTELRSEVTELTNDERLSDDEQATLCDVETVLTDLIEERGRDDGATT
jgi:hypothetical protein